MGQSESLGNDFTRFNGAQILRQIFMRVKGKHDSTEIEKRDPGRTGAAVQPITS
jgi:hypothetical protein